MVWKNTIVGVYLVTLFKYHLPTMKFTNSNSTFLWVLGTITAKFPCAPLQSPTLWQPLTIVLSLVLPSIEFQTMETYINLILVVVCVWLLSLSVTLLRFIHIVVQYPLMAEWHSIVLIYKNLIMHSPLMDIWVVSRFWCHK